eukprot:8493009-Alexandrium_andersonii.AAC.1
MSQTIRPGAQPGWSGGDVGCLTIHILRTSGPSAWVGVAALREALLPVEGAPEARTAATVVT